MYNSLDVKCWFFLQKNQITTALRESVLQLYVTLHNRTTTDVTYISMRLTSTISE